VFNCPLIVVNLPCKTVFMQTIPFKKYQGTGNDFVMIDNRTDFFPKNNVQLVAAMCDRKKGIGADGLLLLENDVEHDFRMVYYNADGKESTMCGNGGRCIVAFAKELGVIQHECRFIAIDGLHQAEIFPDGRISLQMTDVNHIKSMLNGVFLDTGSPHHVEWITGVEAMNVFEQGKKIRNHDCYAPGGTNVNFVETLADGEYLVRTFERGVEDETLSCGTGATAVAIAAHHLGKTQSEKIKIKVMGGTLEVYFQYDGTGYKNVYLTGPAEKSFEGNYQVKSCS